MTTVEPTTSLIATGPDPSLALCLGCGASTSGCELKLAIRRRRCCDGCSHDNPSTEQDTTAPPTERGPHMIEFNRETRADVRRSARIAADFRPDADYERLLALRDNADPRWAAIDARTKLALGLYEGQKLVAEAHGTTPPTTPDNAA